MSSYNRDNYDCPHPGCKSHVTHPCEVCGYQTLRIKTPKSMTQGDLLCAVINLPIGSSFTMSEQAMRECAAGDLRSAFDGPVRDTDVEQFTQKICENWGINLWHDHIKRQWHIHKPQGD